MANAVSVTRVSALITRDQLSELFGCCGTIKEVQFRRESDGTQAAHVEFSTPEAVQAALGLSGVELGDMSILVAPAAPPQPTPAPGATTAVRVPPIPAPNAPPGLGPAAAGRPVGPPPGPPADPGLAARMKRQDDVSRTIFISGLQNGISEAQLKDVFSRFGPVAFVRHGDANKAADGGANPTRYSFIEFKSQQSVPAALGMSGVALNGLPIRVSRAINPINKASASAQAQPKKLPLTSDVMRRIKMHAARITRRIMAEENGQRAGTVGSDDSKARDRRRGDQSASPPGEDRRRRRRSRSRDRRGRD